MKPKEEASFEVSRYQKTLERSTIRAGELDSRKEYKCRICLRLGDDDEELCAPCECTGSIKYIHTKCLKEWIKEKRHLKCELCGSDYRKKWKDWAIKNKVIQFGPKGIPISEKLLVLMRVLLIVYLNITLVFTIWQYSKDFSGIKSKNVSSLDRLFIKLCAGLLVFAFGYNTLQFYTTKSFQKKIENHVEKLFPHSNNADYASELNLPVANSIKT